MRKVMWFLLLWVHFVFAIPVVNLAHFNGLAWSGFSFTILGMSQVLTVKSAGVYSWALGYQTPGLGNVAYFDGATWHDAESIAGMSWPTQILPMYDDGHLSQAFAVDARGLVAYFDGVSWGAASSVNAYQSLSLLTSEGQAFAFNMTSPISVSFFDPQQRTWSAPHDLSAYFSKVMAMAEANGKFYLLGRNLDGDVILFSGNVAQAWNVYNFGRIQTYNMQLVASGDSVFVALMSDAASDFYYSRDQGQTWNSTAWSGGLLFSPVEQGILWGINDPNIEYFDSNAVNPSWQILGLPPGLNGFQLYSNPSFDGRELCVESDDGPQISCYNLQLQQWQNIPTETSVTEIGQIFLLNSGQLIASGADQEGHPALFYYSDNAWKVSHVPGLLKSIENLYSGPSFANIWALGHD